MGLNLFASRHQNNNTSGAGNRFSTGNSNPIDDGVLEIQPAEFGINLLDKSLEIGVTGGVWQIPLLQGSAANNGKVVTWDEANERFAFAADGGVTGSGTINKSTIWTSGTTIGDGILLDDGTGIGIGAIVAGTTFYLQDSTASTLIRAAASKTSGSTTAIIGITNGTSSGINKAGEFTTSGSSVTNIGLDAGSNSNSTAASSYGIRSTSLGSTTENIAGIFTASGTNPFALQLVDGSEGIGKVLTSDVNGKCVLQSIDVSYSGIIRTGEDATFVIDESAPFDYTINNIKVRSSTGTVTLKMKIVSTDIVGITAVSVTTSQATGTATDDKSVTAGDQVKIILSSNSSAEFISYTVNATKTGQ